MSEKLELQHYMYCLPKTSIEMKTKLTIFIGFCKQNWRRLYEDSRIHRLQMRIKAIGNLAILPIGLQEILCKLENVTAEYKSMFLNIAIAYGGQKEIVEAIKKIALMAKCEKSDIEKIDEKLIESFLYTSHLPNRSLI